MKLLAVATILISCALRVTAQSMQDGPVSVINAMISFRQEYPSNQTVQCSGNNMVHAKIYPGQPASIQAVREQGNCLYTNVQNNTASEEFLEFFRSKPAALGTHTLYDKSKALQNLSSALYFDNCTFSTTDFGTNTVNVVVPGFRIGYQRGMYDISTTGRWWVGASSFGGANEAKCVFTSDEYPFQCDQKVGKDFFRLGIKLLEPSNEYARFATSITKLKTE
uniref:Uncharacterized protein n=1 Tax=Mucochytrium quahogii TaxID=96639 RepID=A0A7S2S3B2_9STRA|mmetsp:Transcript_6785/g.11972  ORF Transcript_6785/g.11972 Transcript_6785/m.11972 type:complete len:222 (+) Transcript_6785:242-907(+)